MKWPAGIPVMMTTQGLIDLAAYRQLVAPDALGEDFTTPRPPLPE